MFGADVGRPLNCVACLLLRIGCVKMSRGDKLSPFQGKVVEIVALEKGTVSPSTSSLPVLLENG